MTIRYPIGQAHHALDKNQLLRLFAGYGHISGGPVVKSTDNEVTAPTPWDVFIDGSVVNVDPAANSVAVPAANGTQPRWDLVTVDLNGAVGIISGDPGDLVGDEGLEARNPAPPAVQSGDVVVIGAIFRRAGEADFDETLLFDRRFDSDMSFRQLYAVAGQIDALDAVNAVVSGDLDVQGSFDVEAGANARVADPPTAATEIVRKAELDALEATTLDHDARHENGGADEMNVAGLSGVLADRQDPQNHGARHLENAEDELLVDQLGAASNDTNAFFAPDGTGGVIAKQAGTGATENERALIFANAASTGV